jgi:hypothetical protein
LEVNSLGGARKNLLELRVLLLDRAKYLIIPPRRLQFHLGQKVPLPKVQVTKYFTTKLHLFLLIYDKSELNFNIFLNFLAVEVLAGVGPRQQQRKPQPKKKKSSKRF